MNKKILVYVELVNNKIHSVTKEIISKLRTIANNSNIDGIVLLDDVSFDLLEQEVSNLNLDNIHVFKNNCFSSINTTLFAQNIATFLTKNTYDIFLMGATANGRDIAPRTASKLDIGLTADCTEIEIDETGQLLATRPTYGGELMATIISKTKPNFATIRPGVFKVSCSDQRNTNIHLVDNISNTNNQLIEYLENTIKEEVVDWTKSEIIISGGLGLQNKESFKLIYKLSELLNAKPAATRSAVELGWANEDIQVGQTGYTVSPVLYLAFGISGAIQHMVGIKNSDKIIAINTDENAPLMKNADIAIVADATDVLKKLIDIYSK